MRYALLVVGLVAFLAPTAFGHAKVVKSEPKRGAVLTTAPAVVRIVFNEELRPKGSILTVADARGRRVDDGKGGVDLNDLDRTTMVTRLKPLSAGTYTVRWTAVSADDLFVAKGSFRFRVAAISAIRLPPVRIVAPRSGGTIASPVRVIVETEADLAKMTMASPTGMKETTARLHVDIDKRVTMPTMKQLTALGAHRYQVTLGTVPSGPHSIRVYWADAKMHKPMGAVWIVSVIVK
ncbi:MAG TPA: copper resistance protein CopC [bacterium]|jgi:hypothetical protein|nr:copper resistance protein CopC [bacterium]